MTAATPDPIASLPGGPYAASARPFVVVVDDSADMRGLITDVLEADGFDVTAVQSGPRALQVMDKRRPDLVIMDLLMPGMSGFSLRAVMLRRPDLAKVPVVVLSAYWHRPSETLEVHDVLTKPVNLDRLMEITRRLIGQPMDIGGH